MRSIARSCPQTVAELEKVRGIGQEKSNQYAEALLALCQGRSVPPPAVAASVRVARDSDPGPIAGRSTSVRQEAVQATTRPTEAAMKPISRTEAPRTTVPLNPVPLNPAQQALEQKLRAWRGEQASAAGLPSFFILSETALRCLVTHTPGTLADLGALQGMGPDKVERYGAALLALCRN